MASMDFSATSGVLSGIIFAISASWYTVDVAKNKVTPSIATFLMFSLVNLSQLASLLAERVWNVIPFTLVGVVTSIAICVIALRSKKFYFELPDKIALFGALLGFILWITTSNAAINLYVVNIVQIITFTPLIIKSFKRPDLETILPWHLNLFASFLLLLSVNSLAAVVWVVPVRQFLCSLLLNLGLLRGKLHAKP